MTKPVSKKEPEIRPTDNKSEKKGSIFANIIVTSIVCGIFVGANYFLQQNLLKSQLKTVTAEGMGLDEEARLNRPEKGIILDLGEFTMNLSDVNPRRFLKISVAIEVTNPHGVDTTAPNGGHGEKTNPLLAEMEQYRPAIRDSIITVMTSKNSHELATAAGKELAKQEITDAVNDVFDGEREVMRVSFGEFIMQ